MTTAPEYRQNGSTVLAPTRTDVVSGHPRPERTSATVASLPVLRRLPLPVTEPPFDDEIGLTAGRPTPVAARGRIVYLPGTATGPSPADASARAGVATTGRATTGSATTGIATTGTATAGIATAPLTSIAGTSTGVLPDLSIDVVDAVSALGVATVTDLPVRLHLVAPVTRRVSPSTRGVRPARPIRPNTPLERPDPSDGFAPGPRVDVDSTATRSRLLGSTDESDAATRASAAPVSDPRPLAAQVVQAVVEILAGDRQLTQLTAWVDEEVYAAVAAAAPEVTATPAPSARRTSPARTRPEDRPMVRSVHVCQPGPGVAEVVARVQTGGRSCAVALRLEGWRGRWRCNALTVG